MDPIFWHKYSSGFKKNKFVNLKAASQVPQKWVKTNAWGKKGKSLQLQWYFRHSQGHTNCQGQFKALKNFRESFHFDGNPEESGGNMYLIERKKYM